MNLGTAQIIQGNALNLPLPNNSVDAVITSPPYFGLRSYQDAGQHYDGQIGSEATPAEFLDALLAATREMMRVLKPSGSIFVNLGDKYAGGAGDQGGTGMRQKSLMGIPWRYALRCIDDLGLILRAEIIWNKPNGLPESVTDRVRRSHEQWFHFVRQPRYFAAVDEIREAHTGPDVKHFGRIQTDKWAEDPAGMARPAGLVKAGSVREYNPLGKLPGSVWTIPTQPLTVPPELGVDHFAAYPMEWPRRIIMGWTPNGICVECGEGRRPDTKSEAIGERRMAWGYQTGNNGQRAHGGGHAFGIHTITGYTCACYAHLDMGATSNTTPAIVLDPFGGTGTTALVAKALGRTGITIDLSSDYCRLAEWRCNDPGQLAAALQVEKPDLVPDDQLNLFEDNL